MVGLNQTVLQLKPQSCPPTLAAQQIVRICRTVADLERAESFYRDALGFRAVKGGVAALTRFTNPNAQEIVMRLGQEEMSLVRFMTAGRPYPSQSRSDDGWFQHAAIVVNDIDAAYAHLSRYHGWRSISEDGPQLLPPSSGAVRAFKFRDPDDHPLELLWFPPGEGRAMWQERRSATPFLGIDHSALVVASTARSLRFYRALGFQIANESINRGPAQTRLDGLAALQVRVTALRPALASGPGLELLEYQPTGRSGGVICPNDEASDRVTLAVNSSIDKFPHTLQDPDGHQLMLIDEATARSGSLREDR